MTKEYFDRITEVDTTINSLVNDNMCKSSTCRCSDDIKNASQMWTDVGMDITTNAYYYEANSDVTSFAQVYDCLINQGTLSQESDEV